VSFSTSLLLNVIPDLLLGNNVKFFLFASLEQEAIRNIKKIYKVLFFTLRIYIKKKQDKINYPALFLASYF
tara:strand:+ start:1655 stop:1867 length:213 start_codon:yes stop_codon:yes gene_type:complete